MNFAFLQSGGGGAADSNLLGSIAGHTAGLSANGAIERCRKFVDISFGTLVVRDRTSAARHRTCWSTT